MENQLKAKEIFGRGQFRSYSEFYLALAMGNVLQHRGMSLNMDGMLVDPDVIPSDMILYYKKLLYDGAITLSMYERGKEPDEMPKTYVDTSYYSKVKMYDENGDKLDWTFDVVHANYGEYMPVFLELLQLGNTLVHLVAYHLINHILDGENRKLVIHLDNQKAKSTFIYVNIYSCLQTMNWIKDYVELDVDFGDYNVDLDYSIHCNNGKVAGRFKLFTVKEKIELMRKYNMVEGAILVMWERDGMCDNNPYGKVKGTKLFRLEEIGDDFLGMTFISINKTKEEVRQDYFDMDEQARSLFVDMLDKKPYEESTELDIHGMGIDNYFLFEDRFITLLDESEEVYKLVTIDGKLANVKMRAIDAIYWLLCQYEVEFDRELFKDMYYDLNETPLWDMYN